MFWLGLERNDWWCFVWAGEALVFFGWGGGGREREKVHTLTSYILLHTSTRQLEPLEGSLLENTSSQPTITSPQREILRILPFFFFLKGRRGEAR